MRGSKTLIAEACLGAVAPSAHAARPRCRRLPGRDLAPSHRVKVTRTRSDLVRACLGPDGPVRLVWDGRTHAITDSTSFALSAVAGTWVGWRGTVSDQYGTREWASAFDVADGGGHRVWTAEPGGGEETPVSATLDRWVLDARGHSATAVGLPLDETEAIRLVTSDGTAVEVDRGAPADVPPSSLTFTNGVAAWSHAGRPQSASFGPAARSSG